MLGLCPVFLYFRSKTTIKLCNGFDMNIFYSLNNWLVMNSLVCMASVLLTLEEPADLFSKLTEASYSSTRNIKHAICSRSPLWWLLLVVNLTILELLSWKRTCFNPEHEWGGHSFNLGCSFRGKSMYGHRKSKSLFVPCLPSLC